MAVKHFKHLPEAIQFYVLCNHTPLTFTMAHPSDTYTPWVQQQLSSISEFTTDIRHDRGVENPMAHMLSRSISVVLQFQVPLDYKQIATDQERDKELAELRIGPSSL